MTLTDCFNESYEDFTKRNNYHKHKLYLKNQYCCDANSCNNLANEYEKLAEECNEAFKKHYETDISGKIMEPTSCSINENRSRDLRKKAAKYGNIQNEGLIPLPIRGPILNPITKSNHIQSSNYFETGGSLKNKSKKNLKKIKNKSKNKNKNKSKKNSKKNNKVRKQKLKSYKA